MLLRMRAVIFAALLAVVSLARGQQTSAPAPAPVSVYQRPLDQDCVSNVNNTRSTGGSGINYFPRNFNIGGTVTSTDQRVTVTVAEDFSVAYYDSYKVVTNLLVNETYALYQCGTPPPARSSLPSGAKLFSIPLTSISVLETIPVAFLNQLGVISRVQSVSSYSTGACAQKLLSCGKTAIDSLVPPLTSGILNSQVAPVSDAAIVSSAYENALTSIAFSASSDPGPLNRAEWFKFLGVFFNLDAVSTQLFDTINSSYYATRASVRPSATRPVLAFISLYTYPPDTAFQVSLAAYKVNFTLDAGAAAPNATALLAINGTSLSPSDPTNSTVWFAWNTTDGSGFPTRAAATTAFQQFLRTVDIVIDETFALDPQTYNYTTFLDNFNLSSTGNDSFIANQAVFREDGLVGPAPTYGLDWFEGAIARPDLVLQDFAQAVNQTAFPDHKPTWLRNIARGQNVTILTSQNCNQIQSCTSAPTPICPFVRACSNGSVASQQSVNSTCSYEACSS